MVHCLGIPPKLLKVILSMMDVDPQKRPTARELLYDTNVEKCLKKSYLKVSTFFLSSFMK